MKWLLRWTAPLILILIMTGSAMAQSGEPAKPKAPGGQYVLAMLSTLLVLVIVCKPSRKS